MKTSIELPSGVKISISARFIDFTKPSWDKSEWHPQWKITLRSELGRYTYDYWGIRNDFPNNKQEMSECDLLESVCCLFADACLWDANREFEEFCLSAGFEKMSDYVDARKCFNGCKRAYTATKRLFDDVGKTHCELEDYVQQHF